MTLSDTKPALPEPNLQRWQPLRLGLVNLFHYDSEEFWFCDGHLLLRGNNGTGKSKVLSLTLPFLFDAYLTSSRIEPDSDTGKKMSWNLLLNKHDRRMGYAWIEFGRLGEDGKPKYLTLGSGMSAVAARPQVESWFFLLDDQRIGEDIWLTSQQRVVLTRERLKEALEGHGHVFETAAAYRRAVDERLFHLGSVRYAALMDTLIQLRQPQLSKKPDEGSLSEALTEALPPLSGELLGDIAEAMNQLEEDHRQLEEYEKLAHAVGQFNTRYRSYASVHSRRQARGLRSAQTSFDNASRNLNEAKISLEAAWNAEREAASRHEEAELLHQGRRAQLEELQSDPAMQDANRMDNAAREAESRHRDRDNAEKSLTEAKDRLLRETETTLARAKKGVQVEQDLTSRRTQNEALAQAAGIGEAYAANVLAAALVPQLAALEADAFGTAHKDLRRLAKDRQAQVVLLRRRHAGTAQAQQLHDQQLQTLDERRGEMQNAAADREQADIEVEMQGERLLDAWQKHIDGLRQLRIDEPTVPLAELASWVLTLEGGNPAASALLVSQQQASLRLAACESELKRARQTLNDERQTLETERARLQAGEDAQPPRSAYRVTDARTGRAGAPFWQLLEFKEGLDDSHCAGLEAALEASGLIDAWVAPDGRLQDAQGTDFAHQPLHDTQLLPRPRISASLADWLQPAVAEVPVPAAIVAELLESVACSATDNTDAETWISPDGRFRLGALAGAWGKPVATFIGFSARAAAREQRLEHIAQRMMELASVEDDICSQLEQNRLAQEQARYEWQQSPPDNHLRVAHATATVCARAFQASAERAKRAEADYQEVVQKLQNARDLLTADAADLHLPITLEELEDVDAGLTAFNDTLHELLQAARELRTAMSELQKQQEREEEAKSDVQQRQQDFAERRQQANEAQARLDLLRESVGAKVDELREKLATMRRLVTEAEQTWKDANRRFIAAGQERVRGEQAADRLEADFQDAIAKRQQAVDQLQKFAHTGLIAVALPDAELPDQHASWTIEPALNLARRVEQALHTVKDDDESWRRVQTQVSQDFTELQRALGALHHQAQAETTDYGMIVFIVYQNRPERPDRLAMRLTEEITQRRELLTAQEREILENHLQAEIAAAIQKLMQDAERQVHAINKELEKRPTSTGVKFRLQWQPLPEGAEGAPVGLETARKRLLNTSAELWSAEDRRVVGAMLQQRIAAERERADTAGGGSMLDQLAQALDYRRWHRFSVQRWQDGQWRKLSGPASSGERALGLTVPLFAAVASFYTQGGYAHAPRLVLLDEAFAGIDDAARAHCMGLIKEFDLDFVITSEREWGCYAALPGVSICHLQRREGIDAVHVSRWTWNGRIKRQRRDPDRRFAQA
jgi:uncharacterized protein (TIGR02680 family)